MDFHLDGPTANTFATNWLKKILGRWFHPQVQKSGISFGGEGLGEGVTVLAAVLLRAASCRALFILSFPDRNVVFFARAMSLASLQIWVVKDALFSAMVIAVFIGLRPAVAHSIWHLRSPSESSGKGLPWKPVSEKCSGFFFAVVTSVNICSTNIRIITLSDERDSVVPSLGSNQNLFWFFIWKTFSTTKIDLLRFGQYRVNNLWLLSFFIRKEAWP